VAAIDAAVTDGRISRSEADKMIASLSDMPASPTSTTAPAQRTTAAVDRVTTAPPSTAPRGGAQATAATQPAPPVPRGPGSTPSAGDAFGDNDLLASLYSTEGVPVPPNLNPRVLNAIDNVTGRTATPPAPAGGPLRPLTPTTVPRTAPPTPQPTALPSGAPTPQPTALPSGAPTPQPTALPRRAPTTQPTALPRRAPTTQPTAAPGEMGFLTDDPQMLSFNDLPPDPIKARLSQNAVGAPARARGDMNFPPSPPRTSTPMRPQMRTFDTNGDPIKRASLRTRNRVKSALYRIEH
jgi:hypothetical protein